MDEPMEIVDAREVLQVQTRFRLALGALAIVGSVGGVGLGTFGVDPYWLWCLVFVTLVGALAVSGVYLPQAEGWKNAESRLALWKKQGSVVAATPDDPRLVAARALLVRIGELGADVADVKRESALVESRLRELLADLGVLEASVAADPEHAALGDARERKSAEVGALLGSLRELHAGLTFRRTEGPEVTADVGELLERFTAVAEVEGGVDPRRERASRASRARGTE